jgi:hypothetical protein
LWRAGIGEVYGTAAGVIFAAAGVSDDGVGNVEGVACVVVDAAAASTIIAGECGISNGVICTVENADAATPL